MGKLIFKKRGKVLLILLQAAAAGILAFCLISVAFWMEDSFSFAELSRSYEESELFFRQVDTILTHKIKGQDNDRLLESGGELNLGKQIDIQSYDEDGSVVHDMNTTYLLGDLLDFYENGGWQALHTAIADAQKGRSAQEAGELLDEKSDTLETIYPVTGISLAECSRWYSDSAGYVLEMYTKLDEAVQDIYSRYREYTTQQDESWSEEAPSNLLYCIENTSTGELYTNTGAESYEEAVKEAENAEGYVSLYEGERSFNIMVTNPERVLNTEASEWFLDDRFVGTNEKVYVAVDTSYPAGDELQTWAEYYARRENIVRNACIGGTVSLAVLVICFVCTLLGAGWIEGKPTPQLLRIDRVPTELAAGFYLILVILCILLAFAWPRISDHVEAEEPYLLSGAAALGWLLFVSACTSFLRRKRSHMLWSNSILRMLIRTWKQVNASRAASGQLLLQYIGFFILNFVFLLLFGRFGLALVVLMDLAVLLYLLRDMAGKQNIYEGIHQISKGDLLYRIDTSSLQGETLEMAKAVNEMGESLGEAVEAIVKNERLKAELITNVSHDLKTPLTSIVNYVDLLKREHLEGERVQHYIEVLDQKSQRLKQLTEDLVEASKISSGNIELNLVRVELQSMLMQACGEFEEKLEEKQLHISWDMEKEPVCIMADGRQLWRILENLLGNIYKYAMEGTEVRVELHRRDENVMIALKNTARETITVEADELTGRFVRGDKSRSTEGSGLGLSIAQNLAALLDGRLELRTEGNQFWALLFFPVVPSQGEQ